MFPKQVNCKHNDQIRKQFINKCGLMNTRFYALAVDELAREHTATARLRHAVFRFGKANGAHALTTHRLFVFDVMKYIVRHTIFYLILNDKLIYGVKGSRYCVSWPLGGSYCLKGIVVVYWKSGKEGA